MCMIISIPFSWNPIWGGKIGDSQITWFYIWLLFYIVYSLFNRNKIVFFGENSKLFGVCGLLLVYSFIPLLMSNSIIEGLKEFLMIGVFLILIMLSDNSRIDCTETEIKQLIDLYIFVMFLTSFGMFIQYIAYKVFSIELFGFKRMYSFGGGLQTGCHLLMEDASSGTIMLGVGGFLALINRNKKLINYFQLIIIIIGMACSGRRTGAVMFGLVMILYILLGIKSSRKKAIFLIVGVLLGSVLLYFMSASRSISNASQLFYNNGRFQLWYEGIMIYLRKPLFGYGFDNAYLANQIMPSKMIVHNTLIRYFDMGGIFLGVGFTIIYWYWLKWLKKTQQTDLYWSIIFTCSAAMLIPDVLNARFLYPICIISFMAIKNGKNTFVKLEANVQMFD